MSGCLSSVPLDSPPNVRADKSLLGQWHCKTQLPEPETESGTLTVTATDDLRLLVELREEGQELERYEAYASTIGGDTVFNVQAEPGSPELDPHPWVFVRARMVGRTLRLQALNYQETEAPQSSEALHARFEARAKDPDFYLDVCECQKQP